MFPECILNLYSLTEIAQIKRGTYPEQTSHRKGNTNDQVNTGKDAHALWKQNPYDISPQTEQMGEKCEDVEQELITAAGSVQHIEQLQNTCGIT